MLSLVQSPCRPALGKSFPSTLLLRSDHEPPHQPKETQTRECEEIQTYPSLLTRLLHVGSTKISRSAATENKKATVELIRDTSDFYPCLSDLMSPFANVKSWKRGSVSEESWINSTIVLGYSKGSGIACFHMTQTDSECVKAS